MSKSEVSNISAFSYETAKLIEDVINERTKNLVNTNAEYEAKILQWFFKTKDEEFAKFFGITAVRRSNL